MKIRVSLSIGYPSAKRETVLEIDDEVLEGITEEEQEKIINEYIEEWMWNYIDTGYEIIEE
jgi:hypothetical protein